MHSYQGDDGGDYVGDSQGFSNIDDTPRTLLYELWLEQKIPDRNLSVRVGKIDVNSIFATVENGANFLNSSMGYSPTTLKLPTYPQPRASVNVIYDDGQRSGAGGLFASDGSGPLWLAEGGSESLWVTMRKCAWILGSGSCAGDLIVTTTSLTR